MFWSKYLNKQERKVDYFLRSFNGSASQKSDLLALMKEDLIVLSVWIEKEYKGYKILQSKKFRKKIYQNSERLKQKVKAFSSDKKLYIEELIDFLYKGGRFNYQETSAFYKLLEDDNLMKMVGDCNQIVTLWAFLYGLKFDIRELKIKILKDHVCLVLGDQDFEATNGQKTEYKEYKFIGDILEIISVNLLDFDDFREKRSGVSVRKVLEAARISAAISSFRDLVANNLQIAYRNIAAHLVNSDEFSNALHFIKKIADKSHKNRLLEIISYKFVEKKKFNRAIYYADLVSRDLVSKIKRIRDLERYNVLVKRFNLAKRAGKKQILNELIVLAKALNDPQKVESLKKILLTIK